MAVNLVIFFSREGQNYMDGKIVDLEVGNAERLAEYISDAVNADMFEVCRAKPYPEDYYKCTEEAKKELRDNARPKLVEYMDSLAGYKNIFLVGPCWWGTYPMPMFAQIEKLDFRDKRILPVVTHEGSGMGSVEKDLRKFCKGAKLINGIAVQGSKVPDVEKNVKDWAVKNAK